MFDFSDTMRTSLGISLNAEMSFYLHGLSDLQFTVSLLIGD